MDFWKTSACLNFGLLLFVLISCLDFCCYLCLAKHLYQKVRLVPATVSVVCWKSKSGGSITSRILVFWGSSDFSFSPEFNGLAGTLRTAPWPLRSAIAMRIPWFAMSCKLMLMYTHLCIIRVPRDRASRKAEEPHVEPVPLHPFAVVLVSIDASWSLFEPFGILKTGPGYRKSHPESIPINFTKLCKCMWL